MGKLKTSSDLNRRKSEWKRFQEGLKSAFELPLTVLEKGESICLILLGILSCIITSSSSARTDIQTSTSVMNIFMGIYGAIFIHLKLTTKTKWLVFLVLWLIPTIILFSIVAGAPGETVGIVFFLYFSAFSTYFFMLRFFRSLVFKFFGERPSQIFSMVLNSVIFIFYSALIRAYLDDNSRQGELAKIAISSAAVFYIIITIILWIQHTGHSFAYYTRQEYLLVKDAYRERPFDPEHVINCGILIEESDTWFYKLQEKSFRIFSVTTLVVLVIGEIAMMIILTDFSAPEERFPATGLYLASVPGLVLTIVAFSSADIQKDDRVLSSTILGGILILVLQSLSVPFENNGYDGLVLFMRWAPPIATLLLLTLIYLFQYNKRCYQLSVPIFTLVFAISVGFLPVVYSSEDTEVASAVLNTLVALFCLALIVVFWCLGTVDKFKALLSVLFNTTASVNWFDIVQFIYCAIFIWSLNLLVYFFIKADQRDDETYRKGLLLGSIFVIVLLFGMTVYMQKVILYVKKLNVPELTLKEIEETNPYAKEITDTESPFNILYRKNKRNAMGIILFSFTLSFIILISSLIQINNEFMVAFGVSTILSFIVIGIVFALMLKLKGYLMNFGRLYLAYSCGGCWFFVILPIFVIGPIVISSMKEDNEEDMESLSLWATGLVFIMLLGGVSALSIFLNNILKSIEQEVLARKCIDAVSQKMIKYRTKASKDVIRTIYQQYLMYGEETTTDLLLEERIFTFFEFNDPNKWFINTIIPSKKAQKRRKRLHKNKNKSQEYSEMSEDTEYAENDPTVQYETIEQEEGKSCFDIFKQLFSKKNKTEVFEDKEEMLYPSSDEEEYDDQKNFEKDFRKLSFEYMTIKEKVTIMREQQYSMINTNPKIKEAWMSLTFDFFCKVSYFDIESFLKFLELSDLKNGIIPAEIEGIKNEYFHHGSISRDKFRTDIMARLAQVKYGKPGHEKRLFDDYIYPNIVFNVPSLRTVLIPPEPGKYPIDFTILENRPRAMFQIKQSSNEVNLKLPSADLIEELADIPICLEKLLTCFSNVLEFVLSFIIRLALSMFYFCVPFKGESAAEKKKEDEAQLEDLENYDWPFISHEIVFTFKQILDDDESQNESSSFEWNSANITAMFENLFELFGLCMIAFHSAAGWEGRVSFLEAVSETLLGEEEQYLYLFMSCFVFIIVFYVVSGQINKKLKEGKLGRDENMNRASLCSKSFLYEKAAGLFAQTLFSTIMIAVLTGLSCKLMDGNWVMIANPSQTCFEGEHYFYLIVGLLGLVFYYPRASLLYPKLQYQNWALDLKYTPTFLVIECQGKLLIAGVSVFFEKEEYLWIQLLIVILVCVALSLLCHYTKPCILKEYNQVKTVTYLIPVWVCTCAMLNFFAKESDNLAGFIKDNHVDILFSLLIIGVAALLVFLGILIVVMNRRQRDSQRSSIEFIDQSPLDKTVNQEIDGHTKTYKE